MKRSTELPASLESERFTLGSILLNEERYADAAAVLQPVDFTLERHAQVFRRMGDLRKRGEAIECASLANELNQHGELGSDGLSFLISMTDGLPELPSIDNYIRVVKDKSNRRRVLFAAQDAVSRCMAREDRTEDIVAGLTGSLRTAVEDSQEQAGDSAESIIRAAGGIQAFLEPTIGIPTPWGAVNYATGGWQRGDLILLAARPSMGKTALALNAVWHAASKGTPSAFYSYEMNQESILKRLVSMLARVTYPDLNRGDLNTSERRAVADALATIQEKPLLIVGAAGKTVLGLRAHAERAKREGKLQFAAVDYIGLIRSSDRQQNRNQELGEICRQLKEMGGELGIPMLVLSQLSRETEKRNDKRPLMSDLRDSGELENHADLIAFLHRAWYYNRDDVSLRTHAEFIIAKQRNGDTPIVRMEFQREYGRFTEPDESEGRRVA